MERMKQIWSGFDQNHFFLFLSAQYPYHPLYIVLKGSVLVLQVQRCRMLAAPESAGHLLRMTAVGTSVARKDGIGKATGTAKYADDITFPGMLHGRTIRSTVPRGKIKSIGLDFDTTYFTVVDCHDVVAKVAVDLMSQDQPFLAQTE